MTGELKALTVCDKSVNIERFIEYLKLLRSQTGKHFIYLFVDNLSVHHSRVVAAYCQQNKIRLVLNGGYSSEFNPDRANLGTEQTNFPQTTFES